MEQAANGTTPQVRSDFFQGDIEVGLEKIRLKLLDLGGRNRLLNYRHTKRSSLRVVDEVPDFLYRVLADGKELSFEAVPRPRRPRWAYEPQLPLQSQPGENPPAPEKHRLPTAKEHAEHLGIATSFDLPTEPDPSDKSRGRHADRKIQTLHYPEELESMLRSIASAARLAIEETGTNMLYLAIGFLEWYESDDSNQERFAPLILLPVTIERGAADPETHVYRYTIRHSGEDIVTNLSLQERMKQFNIEIPDLGEDEAPESYFRGVEKIVRRFDRWRVRRQITLTLLSFGKMLMYRDLDPSTWPDGTSPSSHPRIREFFEGVPQNGARIATDYKLDDPEIRSRVPLVIDDADSSQHSALIDAIEGKNLVIKGPPGTGKSQTITNLIAAAMSKGKSVLFVSEKLAALEVVRHRLNRAGLGQFCLELHSHKTQKKALISDLKARLDACGAFPSPRTLNDKLESLESTKQRLTRYVDLVNSDFGLIGLCIYDVLWWSRRSRSRLADNVDQLEQLDVADVTEISLAKLDERRQLVREYTAHLTGVLHDGDGLAAHPWNGVTNTAIASLDERQLLARVQDVVDASTAVEEWLAEFRDRTAFEVHPTGDSIQELIGAIGTLPTSLDGQLPELLPRLRDAGVRQRLHGFGTRLSEWRTLHSTVATNIGTVPTWSGEEGGRLKRLAQEGASELPSSRTVGTLSEAAEVLTLLAADIGDAAPAASTTLTWLGLRTAVTAATAPLVQKALELAQSCPLDVLHLRLDSLEAEGAVAVLRKAIEAVEPIHEARALLASRFNLNLAPEPAEARRHAVTAAAAGWWSFLDANFRATRRAYLAMSAGTGKPTRQQIKEGFQALVNYQEQVRSFESENSWRAVAGEHFHGIDTPITELLSIAEWRAAIRRSLQFEGPDGLSIGEALWELSVDRMAALVEADGSTSLSQKLNAGIDALQRADNLVTPILRPRSDEKLQDISVRLLKLARQHGAAAAALSDAGIPPRYPLENIGGLVERVQRLHELRAALAADQEVSAALGEHFAGVETDIEKVLRTIAFHGYVINSGLPVALKEWLLEQDSATRISDLHHRASQAAELHCRLEAVWERFENLTQLQRFAWFGSRALLGETPVQTIRERASRAVEAPERLTGWLDFLRARAQASRLRLEGLLALAESQAVAPTDVPIAFNFVVSNSMVKAIFRDHPELAEFAALTHEEARQRFVELDRETIKLYRARVAALLDRRPVPDGVRYGSVRNYTDRALIEHEVSKQRRHVPIRQLVNRAGRALQALKPCFMMGPLSVAQYLQPGLHEFDLIVMDEASQLKPEDALGAICRGKQVVVVGDPMQLPPTSFFDRIGDDEEEEEHPGEALTEAESILDVAASLYRPTRMLRWHYRSRHGELIAFSNKEFYDEKLVVFPSPIARSPEFGIKFIHVADGVYQNRRNVIEARRLVDAAFRHMRNHPGESLGIVTLNMTQREVIENEIEQRLKTDPHAQRFVERHQEGLEPLFVKNLENVQGDERDVIFISVTYGANERGHVYQRFGPINGVTGHRRLNVLFTRARKRIGLFSSLTAEQIQPQPTSAWGVHALKNYLAYAATGVLEQARFSGREPDSDFEVEVAEALRKRGYEVVAQVGVAGYFIDLAVKHPRKPDAFVLGIECDGATYHSSLSARDRDRLRQAVLEDLGWAIARIWSADWFKNPSGQVERIVTHLKALLEEDGSTEVPAPDRTATFEVEEIGSSEIRVRPRLTVEQARAKLVELRETEIAPKYPGARVANNILRDQMIDVLLRHRPIDRSEWMERIPFDLRVDTDGRQMAHLDQILEIVGCVV